MNNKLVSALAFTVGAAIGSIVTWRLLKTKYEQIANEEIESAKEYYKGRYSEKKEETEEKVEVKEPIKEYSSLTEPYVSPETVKEVEYVTEPYVISPYEYDTLDDYDTQSLTYYEDNVLADDDYNVIYDAEDIVGDDFAEHFGEYEDDSVYVRNERLQTDYEILRSERKFSEAKPHQMEAEWPGTT